MNIRNRLRNPLARNTLKLSTSNVIMYLLPLIVTPILSRLYTQEDYGEWGVFSSAFLIVNSILFLSYENTIVKSKDEREIPGLCLTCMLVALTIIAGTTLVFLGGRALHLRFFSDFPSLTALVVLLFISMFNQLLYNLSNRYERYTLMSVTNVVQGIGQALFRLVLSAVRSFNGLIVGNILAQLLSVVSYTHGLRRHLVRLTSSRPLWTDVRRLMMRYKNFPLFDAPGLVLEAAIFNMALIILSLFFPKSVIGCYSIIFQFLVLPISLVGSAMSKVYYKEISVAHTDEAIASTTKRVVKMTFLLAMMPITFIVLGGDKLIAWYLGHQWTVAGNFALCLSMMSVPIILTESLLPLYRVVDKQKTRFFFDLVCIILALGGLLIACATLSNIYWVLAIYVTLYSVVRFLLFFNIKQTAKVTFTPKEWYVAGGSIALVYLILLVRLYTLLY